MGCLNGQSTCSGSAGSNSLCIIALCCFSPGRAYEGYQDGGIPGMGWTIALLLAFFTCIVLHELGHSFTARRFGVGVRRILLMPIGGHGRIRRIPRASRARRS